MGRLLTTAMFGLNALLLIGLAWAVLQPLPSTEEIDSDLKQVQHAIREAEAQSDRYESGIIKALIEVRAEALRHTEAMLIQKRTSLSRRISLSYNINSRRLEPANNKELDDILAEIAQAERKLAQSVADAKQYSGGMIQAVALLTVETDRLSVSQLRLKFYSAKHGLPILFPSMPSEKPKAPPGVIVKDREAL